MIQLLLQAHSTTLDRRVFDAVVWFTAFANFADAGLTYWAVTNGIAVEANPIVGDVISVGWLWFFVMKTVAGLTLILVTKYAPRERVAAVAIPMTAGVYLAVLGQFATLATFGS